MALQTVECQKDRHFLRAVILFCIFSVKLLKKEFTNVDFECNQIEVVSWQCLSRFKWSWLIQCSCEEASEDLLVLRWVKVSLLGLLAKIKV